VIEFVGHSMVRTLSGHPMFSIGRRLFGVRGQGARSVWPHATWKFPGQLPAPIQRALDGLSGAVANLALAFGVAVAEVAEVERRRSRLEVNAAVARAMAQVDEARLAVEDERAETDAVRAEVARHEATIATKDAEIEALRAELAADQDQPDSAAPKPRRSRPVERLRQHRRAARSGRSCRWQPGQIDLVHPPPLRRRSRPT
jgi:hypothetical protein